MSEHTTSILLGIDEAGRGPWAGPLVVGAVVLAGATIDGLADSKKLTKRRRRMLAPCIMQQAQAAQLGWVSAVELDMMGLSLALQLATIRAVAGITVPYNQIIIDGTVNFLAGTGKGAYVRTMPKADALIPSASAASIIAKVARDEYMAQLDDTYPGYGFGSHAGYGTARHRQAIDEHGITPEHRVSFAPIAPYAAQLPTRDVFSGEMTGSIRQLLMDASGGTWHQPTASHASVTTRQLGDASEQLVSSQLEADGHKVLARNWRTRWCEIDIISCRGKTLYFTEVKHRKTADYGAGLAAISARKQQQMRFAAELFLARHPRYAQYNARLQAASTIGTQPRIEQIVTLNE